MEVGLKDGEKGKKRKEKPLMCLGIVLILINLQNTQQFLSGSFAKLLNQ